MFDAEREELLGEDDEDEDIQQDEVEENVCDDDGGHGKDPILQSIGDFGLYQFLICVIGFFITIPHCWISLR